MIHRFLASLSLRSRIVIGIMISLLPTIAVVGITYYSALNTAENSKRIVRLTCRHGVKEIDMLLQNQETLFADWIKEDIYGMAIEFQAIDELCAHFASMLNNQTAFSLLALTDLDGAVLAAATSPKHPSADADALNGRRIGEVAKISRSGTTMNLMVNSDILTRAGLGLPYAALFAVQTLDSGGRPNGYFLAYSDWFELNARVRQIYAEMKQNGFENARVTVIDGATGLILSSRQPDRIGRGFDTTPALTAVISGVRGDAFAELRFNNDDYLAVFLPLYASGAAAPDSGQYLAAFISESAIKSDIRRIVGAAAVAGLSGGVFVLLIGLFIAREIIKPLSLTTTELQTASEQLKAAAQEQLTGAIEQATATNEIIAVMDELVAAHRQISNAAHDVVSAAEETNRSAEEGNVSLEAAVDGMEKIKMQVENVVKNMLALGEKTQQMSLALEIINELSEQTTILSYNATIEAAGAGESGRRFSAIAEQIMKLANKAVDSTKEIKIIIDEVQKSANTTVLATEDGMKAVDEGRDLIQNSRKHFGDILSSAEENLTSAKEIELTISQQTAAVDQTAEGVKNIKLTAEEVKTSSNQTLKTAEQMLEMARRLSEI